MEIITKKEFIGNISYYLDKISKGDVFVYPTDTIYGIGCIATDPVPVSKVREAKKMPEKPISVIAPSKQWVYDNCYVDEKAEEWLEKLPGKYTLILKLKNKNAVADNVSFGSTIGIRIPKIWLYEELKKINKPILTTSVNITGQKFAVSVSDIDDHIAEHVGFAIDDGKLEGNASTIIDLTKEDIGIIKR